MNKFINKQLKEALQSVETPVNQVHMHQTCELAKLEWGNKVKRERVKYSTFLKLQIRFIGWKIWLVQSLLLVAIILSLRVILNDKFFYENEHFVAFGLSCLSVLILFTAVPFIQRSFRYKMHEIETTSRFSAINLLMSKLLIIGIGDIVLLTAICWLANLKTSLNMGSVFLYLLLPFLILSCGFLYLIGHISTEKLSAGSIGLSAVLLTIIVLLNRFYTDFFLQNFSVGWAVFCLILVLLCILQLHYIVYRSNYAEMQIS